MSGTPEAAIAAAVIRLAIFDAQGHVVGSRGARPDGTTQQQMVDDAREFLTHGSVGLEFWADVAGLDSEAVAQASAKRGPQLVAARRLKRDL
jgi:hypothetical protein